MEVDGLSGETLAHFRIDHRIGSGGMGVVYRAEDVLLRRPVALKVLQSEQMRDERRRARFLREARTAAGLVHPNIATIYEVGEAGGTIFIAMELVPGESLRAVLEGGRLDVPRSLKWAIDIARALAKAHEAGIVHRDLKPDNVMITPDGEVKLLDFGVAKALVEEPTGSGDPALDVTAAQAMTGEGTLVGTPEYMSPEQARGDRIDVRSDLFSFGALLSEMLVGRSPFRRTNVVETVVALTRDPAPSVRSVRTEVPLEIDAVIERCLAKAPDERYANGSELLAALRAAAKVAPSIKSPMAETLDGAAATKAPAPRRRRAAALGAAGVALSVVAAGVFALRHGPAAAVDAPPASALARDAAPPAAPSSFVERMIGGGKENNGWSYDVSPDGAHIVYDDGTGVWTQDLPAGLRVPLPIPRAVAETIVGLDFTSNDAIAYVTSKQGTHASELWTLGLHDAAPRRVRGDAFEVAYGQISRDGRRFAYVTKGGIHVGAVDGAAPKRVVTLADSDYFEGLDFVPGADALVYIHGRSGDTRYDLVWVSADGESTSTIERSASLVDKYGGGGVAFAAPDRLLLLRYDHGDTTLEEVPLGARGAFAGPARQLFAWHGMTITQLRQGNGRIVFTQAAPNGEVVRFDLSPDGAHVGAPSTVLSSAWTLRPIGWLDATHIAVVEEQEGFSHVVSASLDGSTTTYVPGPLTSAWLAANGDVLYWTKGGRHIPGDGGWSTPGDGCALMRHRASDGAEVPAPQAGTSCGSPIACVGSGGDRAARSAGAPSRCVALELGDDLVSTFRDWDPEVGATGPPLVRIEAPDIRFALSPDGKLLATSAVLQGSMAVHDLVRGTTRTFDTSRPHNGQSLSFSPDSTHLLVTGSGGTDTVSTFDTAIFDLDGKSHVLATDSVRWSVSPRFAPDGKSFVVGRKNFGSHLWLLEPGAR